MSVFISWSHQPAAGYFAGIDLIGYQVAATDGDIGKVDAATYDSGSAGLGSRHRVDLGPAGVAARRDGGARRC
jgi:hypothetical protein